MGLDISSKSGLSFSIGYGAFTADQVQACYLTTIALTTGDVMTADECMRRFKK